MHLKHACLPISPPEQVLKTSDSILYSDDARKGVSEKKLEAAFRRPQCTLDRTTRLAKNSVLSGLGHAEFHLRAGRNLDRLASGGIAAGASLALSLDKLAETRKDNALRSVGASIGNLEELVVSGGGLLLGDLGGFGDGSHDRGLGCRYLDFLSHFVLILF